MEACLKPESIVAAPSAVTRPTLWPPVTLANGAPSKVEGNCGVAEKSLDRNLPTNTWYCSTPAKALGLVISSADFGFLARRSAKAVSDGARTVTFWAVESAWTTSGTRARRSTLVSLRLGRCQWRVPSRLLLLVRVLRVALLASRMEVKDWAEIEAARLRGSRRERCMVAGYRGSTSVNNLFITYVTETVQYVLLELRVRGL